MAKFCILLLCFSSFSDCFKTKWAHRYILDGQGNVQLSWSTHGQEITFELSVRTLGYIAMGLSPNGGMAGSDIAIGWVKDGQVYLQDRYVERGYLPVLDKIQNWELLNGYENGTHTVLQFKRNFTTCDPQDREITSETSRIIYSYSDTDPVSPDEIKYHGSKRRGGKSTMLLQTKNEANFDPVKEKDLKFWDAIFGNYSMPNEKTTYWCKIIKAPILKTKHHVVRVVPKIQDGHEPYIHHIALYNCYSNNMVELEKLTNEKGHFCYHPNMPDVFKECVQLVAGWGVGGEDLTFPDEAGLSIGDNRTSYFFLEIHYDNPDLHSGVIDNSGFRLYYTPNLRKHDIESVFFSSTFDEYVVIPPGRKKFKTVAHCSTECLSQALPPEGVNIFALLIHMHYLGREMIVRHFRNGTELPPLGVETNYDFNYQEFHYFPERKLLPGDHVVVECLFDSSNMNTTTFGGTPSTDEMCMAIAIFYPKVKMGGCFSSPLPNVVLGLTGVQELNEKMIIKSPSGIKDVPYRHYMQNFNWTEDYVNLVENAWVNGPHQQVCFDGKGQLRNIPKAVSYPPIVKPFVKNITLCLNKTMH